MCVCIYVYVSVYSLYTCQSGTSAADIGVFVHVESWRIHVMCRGTHSMRRQPGHDSEGMPATNGAEFLCYHGGSGGERISLVPMISGAHYLGNSGRGGEKWTGGRPPLARPVNPQRRPTSSRAERQTGIGGYGGGEIFSLPPEKRSTLAIGVRYIHLCRTVRDGW